MELNANRIFLATALAVGIVWLVCVAFVAAVPGGMMSMTGHMLHADTQHMSWTMNLTGVVVGLIAWSMSIGAIAWLGAVIYNWLDRKVG
jgi:hypothetical protein